MKVWAILILGFCFHLSYSQPVTYKNEIKSYRSKNWAGILTDPRTTLHPKDSIYLRYYPIKESNKVFCDVELLHDQVPFEMPTYSGQQKTFKKYAILHFTWRGKKVKLYTYQNLQLPAQIYKNHLFLPFKDLTSGRQTYDGGRYIDIQSTSIQHGKLLLDLNQVYNPWCAYSDGYNCPIPPEENRLAVAIKSGEKKFTKHP